MQRIIVSLAFILLARVASAAVIDAPHNAITCATCHSYSLWWQYSPTSLSPPPDDHTAIVDTVCLACHQDGSGGLPKALTHSATVIGSNLHGIWGVGCTACHNPHSQDQLNWIGTATEPYLVTGTISAATYDSVLGVSTISYTTLTGNPNWPAEGVLATDQDWDNKSLANPNRGLILVHDKTEAPNTFSIVSATAEQITIKGELSANAVDPEYINPQTQVRNSATCNTFGLIYGQLIKATIASKPVKFFDPKGSFVEEGASTTGICQVCHTGTTHFTNSGVFPSGADSHTGRETGNCIACHMHDAGFKGNGHDNTSFTWAGNCRTCHDPDNQVQNITTEIHGRSCGLCHVNPTGGGPRQDGDAANGVDGSAVGATNASSCVDCHLTKLSLTAIFIHHQSATGFAAAGPCTNCHKDSEAIHNHRLIVTRCADCHAIANAAAIDTLHKQDCLTCHQYTGTKLDPVTVANSIAAGKGASGTNVNCQTCHIGMDTDTSQLVAILHHKTATAQSNNCVACHSAVNHSSMVATTSSCTTATCHTGTAGTPTGMPVSPTDGTIHDSCQTCHIFGGAYRSRLVSFTNQKGVNGTGMLPEGGTIGGTDGGGACTVCHTASSALAPLHHASFSFTWGTATCSNCHSGADIVANIHGNKCTLCHVNPDAGDMTRRAGTDGNASLANGLTTASCTVCHDPTAFPTGGIHHDTASAANNDCATTCHMTVDHSTTVTASAACASCHTGTGGTATGVPLSMSDKAVHDACRTCHTFDANKRGILVNFTNQRGLTGSGSLPTGGGVCTNCHTAATISSYHHSNPHTAVGQCETCHIDPRPSWGPNVPGDNGTAAGAAQYGTNASGSVQYRPTQMACLKCHVAFSGANMTVTKFTRTDYTSYRSDWTRTSAHTIPMTGTRINNYGICLSCHYQGSTKVPASAWVGLWHAHPSQKGGSAWIFYDQGWTTGYTTFNGKRVTRGSGSRALPNGDSAHFIPGRSKSLATYIAPQSFIAGFNLFGPNYGDPYYDPSGLSGNRSNAAGMDEDSFTAPAYDTPAFTRITIPITAQLGDPASATLQATTRAVPVFASLAPLSSSSPATDNVKVKSAIYDASAASLTVVASTSSASGCSTLKTWYGGQSYTMSLTSSNCKATIATPTAPASGATVDVTTTNSLGLNVMGYRIATPNPGTIAFNASTYSVAESGGTVTITASRAGGATGAVGANYATTTGGTATAGTDYTAKSGTLTWADGDITDKTFSITITNDTTPESNETVNLALTNPVGGATLGRQNTAQLTIVDNDFLAGTIALTASTYTVAEDAGTVTITANRTGSFSGRVSVNYATNPFGSTAKNGSNYTATAGTLTWENNDSTAKTFTIPILVNSVAVQNTTIKLYINNPTGGAQLGTQNTAVVTIISPAVTVLNDWPTTPQLTGTTGNLSGNFSIGTGSNRLLLVALSCKANAGSTGQTFSATYGGKPLTTATIQNSTNYQTWIGYLKEADLAGRSGDGVSVTVNGVHTGVVASLASYKNVNQTNPVATSGGNSLASVIQSLGGGWYSNTSAINASPLLAGPGGYTIYTWSNGGSWYSDNESYTKNASFNAAGINGGIASKPIPSAASTNPTISWDGQYGSSTSYTLASSGITLNSAAGPASIALSAPAYSVQEDGGQATITVTRLGGASGAISVHYSVVSDGWPQAGIDFTAVSGDLNWAAGDMAAKTFTVPIIDNAVDSYDKLLDVSLTAPSTGVILGSPNTAHITIVNNDTSIAFSASSYSVNENAGTVTITASRIGRTSGAVSVNYGTANGTGMAGIDYTASTGTLTWADGDLAAKTFTIPIIDSPGYTVDKTVNLTLSYLSGSNVILTNPKTATLHIVENEPAPASTIAFNAATYTVNENAGTKTITVNRAGSSTGAISVSYATADGTALAGTDYTANAGTLTWADGDLAAKSFTVAITDNSVFSANKTVNLILSALSGNAGLASPNAAVLTVVENEIQPTVTFSSTNTYRGYENAGTITISVSRTGCAVGPVSVNYTTGNNNAYAGIDYAATSGTLTWADGDLRDKTFTIPVFDNAVMTGTKYGTLQLTSPTGAILGASTWMTLYILDDEAPTIAFTSSTYSVNENEGTATITVSRTGLPAGAISANYATSNGTATAGTYYTAASGVLTWADGDVSNKTFTVPITDNAVYAGNKTVNLTLSSPSGGATLGSPSTAVLTLVDNEAPSAGTLAFSSPTYSVNENGGTATITVTRSGSSAGTAGVSYYTSNGTALSGTNYTAKSGTLSWGSGDMSAKTFTIAITDNTTYDDAKTVKLTLNSPTGGAGLGSQATAVLTIIDNEL